MCIYIYIDTMSSVIEGPEADLFTQRENIYWVWVPCKHQQTFEYIHKRRADAYDVRQKRIIYVYSNIHNILYTSIWKYKIKDRMTVFTEISWKKNTRRCLIFLWIKPSILLMNNDKHIYNIGILYIQSCSSINYT